MLRTANTKTHYKIDDKILSYSRKNSTHYPGNDKISFSLTLYLLLL